jgi:hypothetical protein
MFLLIFTGSQEAPGGPRRHQEVSENARMFLQFFLKRAWGAGYPFSRGLEKAAPKPTPNRPQVLRIAVKLAP